MAADEQQRPATGLATTSAPSDTNMTTHHESSNASPLPAASTSIKTIDDHAQIAAAADDDSADASACRRLLTRLQTLAANNHFMMVFIICILLARAYPPLGAVYLAPHITATWVAVVVIFLLSGLNLKSSEFKYAFKQVGFNAFVQVYNFIVVSAVVYGVSRGLAAANILSQELADGMVICSCLSVSINIAIVLTKAAGGDEAAAIFDAAFGNLIGVFLSPVLILAYLKQWGDVNLFEIFYKLTLKVLLPLAFGQLLQKTCQQIVDFIAKYKKYFGRVQEYSLLFIIYTVFAKQFLNGSDNGALDILYLIIFQFISMVITMVGAWYLLKLFFQDKPKLRVMGLYGCTHKTISIGVPLITALYDKSPNIGLYTLPLIIWYPMQIMVGTFLVPRLQSFIRNETARLAGTEADDGSSSDDELDQDYGDDVEKGQVAVEKVTAVDIAEQDSCVGMSWADKALVGAQDSDHLEVELAGVSLAELDAVSDASIEAKLAEPEQ